MWARVADTLVGLALGGLMATAGSYWMLGRSVVRLEVEVVALRRDLDRLLGRQDA